ncbi:MAG: glycosyltransferase family 4 protein [Planctomycetales bacterium]|nr:glycosyltransferase family 4 protein [Planctomycetales bacterium]
MNHRRRVLVITRHFWPTTSDDTLRLQHWVRTLHGDGAEVTVLTPRWHVHWPRQIYLHEIPVLRLDHPPTSSLRMGRYTRQLGQWLAAAHDQFDVIYCDEAGLEAGVVLGQMPARQPPLVVRYASPAIDRPLAESRPSPRTVDILRRAAVVLVRDRAAHQHLLSLGIAGSSIVRAQQSLGNVYDRSPPARRNAREILSAVNHDLFVKSTDRVLVCPGELTRRWGVELLIRAVAPLVEGQRGLHVWILGDSRERPQIYDALRHHCMHRLIALPGIFTDLQEIFQVADLCVFPAAQQGLGWTLPTCLASGIDVLVSDSGGARQLLHTQAPQLTFAAEEPLQLRQRLAEWLSDARPWGRALRQWMQNTSGERAQGVWSCGELFHSVEESYSAGR